MKSNFDPRRFLEFSKELLQMGFSTDNEAKYIARAERFFKYLET
jgi:hypothetical protein